MTSLGWYLFFFACGMFIQQLIVFTIIISSKTMTTTMQQIYSAGMPKFQLECYLFLDNDIISCELRVCAPFSEFRCCAMSVVLLLCSMTTVFQCDFLHDFTAEDVMEHLPARDCCIIKCEFKFFHTLMFKYFLISIWMRCAHFEPI